MLHPPGPFTEIKTSPKKGRIDGSNKVFSIGFKRIGDLSSTVRISMRVQVSNPGFLVISVGKQIRPNERSHSEPANALGPLEFGDEGSSNKNCKRRPIWLFQE